MRLRHTVIVPASNAKSHCATWSDGCTPVSSGPMRGARPLGSWRAKYSVSRPDIGRATVTATWKDYAGMGAASVAWAASTQLGQILPYSDCFKQTSCSLTAVVVSLLLGLAGVAVSWFAQTVSPDRTGSLLPT